MKLEISIEVPGLLRPELLAELAALAPAQHVAESRTSSGRNRFLLTLCLEERWPDLLLQRIEALVSRLENMHPGKQDIEVHIRNTARSEAAISTGQDGGPFSPVEGIRIIPWNNGNNKIPAAQDIFLEPSQAFGTGLHPSTRLCLYFLKQAATDNAENRLTARSVLDVGCGSGILSIAALRLGAARVLGLEIDPEAVRAARRNLHINRLDHAARIMEISWPHVAGQYDLVLANLVPSVLFRAGPHIAKLLKKKGLLITAGFPAVNAGKVARLFSGHDLHLLHELTADGWGALFFSK
jgi:ribosomal protein L11 methyltransferase